MNAKSDTFLVWGRGRRAVLACDGKQTDSTVPVSVYCISPLTVQPYTRSLSASVGQDGRQYADLALRIRPGPC
jgi:hypothetical protein